MTTATTCRRCTECEGMEHHWMLAMPDPDDPEDPYYVFEAVAAWRAEVEANPDTAPFAPVYFCCKHCDAWRPWDERDDAAEERGEL